MGCGPPKKKMHIGVIFNQYMEGAVSQLIAMTFGTLIELTYVIKFF